MSLPKTLLAGLGGALCALAVVLSFGDDAPVADAAVDAACNCATPEPLEQRLRTITVTQTVGHDGDTVILEANCQTEFEVDGTVAIAGGCRTDNATNSLTLRWSNQVEGAASRWQCLWVESGDNGPYTVTVQATCLVPEGTPQ